MKATRHNLKKIEELFEELSYDILYEKGTFNSGYCLVEQQKKIVINKFYDIEARMNTLTDLLVELAPDFDHLSESAAKTLASIYQENENH